MDAKTLSLLEFHKIAQGVAFYALSQSAKERLLSENPSSDYGDVVLAQNLTAEAATVTEKYLISPIVGFDPIKEQIARAKIGATLQMGELLKIAMMIRAARIARSGIFATGEDVVLLKRIAEGIFVDESLEKDINLAIVSENEMSDNASDKLKAIRRKIAQTNAKLKEKLSSYTRNSEVSQYLQDNLVTIRNNRFVLPVKSAFRNGVPGLIHDQSATGSTVFIEPFAVVEMNNELRTLQAEENAEIERILSEFTKRVEGNAQALLTAQECCAELDVAFAKYAYSVRNKCVKPDLNQKGVVTIKNAKHPLLDKNKVVPITVEIGDQFDVLLVTGPNTGGKTVSLKTLGLFCLMTYYGLWLPCDSANVTVFDGIYCDIGDEQSIDNELSTFSSHMVNLVDILSKTTQNSLVLLDELGGGTDPTEGAALALGILSRLLEVKAKAVVTTHYNELKEFGITTDRVENASMQFDSATYAPTYRLLIGMPGTSNALNIAARLGLDREIIQTARSYVSPEKRRFENLLRNAENINNKAISELANIEKERAELRAQKSKLAEESQKLEQASNKIKQNAALQTRKLVSDSMLQANDIIEQMEKLLQKADEKSLLQAKMLRSKLSGIDDEINREDDFTVYEPFPLSQIKQGASCFVISLRSEATISADVDKKHKVGVRIGNMTLKVDPSDLAILPQKQTEKKKQKKTEYKPAPRVVTSFLTELKVLGLTVDEAIAQIEPYLISMHENEGNKTIKIVHGKGTMALAKGLHRYFKSLPIVEEFRYGRYGEGDNGVTFVTVK